MFRISLYSLLTFTFVSGLNQTVYNQTEVVTLTCPLDSDIVVWSKDNKTLEDLPGYKVEEKELVFQLNKKTLGQYICESPHKGRKEFDVFTKPIMEGEFQQHKNAINDETFVFECKGFGHPRPVVVWKKGNATLEIDGDDVENPRVTTKNSSDMDSAILKIKRVQYEDGGEYTCEAHNTYGSSSTMLHVSIKDKYAALWPFLGICVEVVVLCAIILLIERRRSKKEEKEVLVETTDKSTSDNKQTEELRQRK